MASSFSTDLKLELMVTGENAGTWGDKTNSNLNLLQQAIAGFQAVSIAGGQQTTALVMTNASISTARNAVVKLTGTITGNQIVTIPDGIEKTYIVENGTSGAFTVEFKTASGTGPTFSTTDKGIKIVYSDGTNVVDVNANLSGPTLASDLDVNGKSIISTSNGNIVLAPNGTGDVQLDADTVRIGDSNANATLTTNGTGDLILNTNSGSNSGSITIKDGTNGDIEITPDGSGVVKLDGLSYPTTDGTADQVLKTNGSGVISFGTISSSPEQLVKSMPLESGNSVTAGNLLSIGSSGEVIPYPVLNTYGTVQTNSSTLAYTVISNDGSRAVNIATSVSLFGGGSNGILTFNGRAISNTATPTNGAQETQTFSTFSPGQVPGVSVSIFLTVFPAGNDRFFLFFGATGVAPSINCNPPGYSFTANVMFITVNGSGTITKGSVTNLVAINNSATFPTGQVTACGRITNNLYVVRATSSSFTSQRIITSTDGSTTITNTGNDADIIEFTDATGVNSTLTTNNIIGLGFGATWRVATFTPSPVGIGAETDSTALADFLSGATWYMMKPFGTNDAEYALVTYTDTSAVARYKTFSINQTTGALTLVETGLQSSLTGWSIPTFKNKDEVVTVNARSFKFTNGVLNGTNGPYTPTGSNIRYNSGDLFYLFSTNPSSFPTNIGYTVNAYETGTFNYLGVAKTTDSTTPVDVVTDGVADGFTSLTPGTVYYATQPFDGSVTTSSASGILVGKAISSTEILLQRSLVQ